MLAVWLSCTVWSKNKDKAKSYYNKQELKWNPGRASSVFSNLHLSRISSSRSLPLKRGLKYGGFSLTMSVCPVTFEPFNFGQHVFKAFYIPCSAVIVDIKFCRFNFNIYNSIYTLIPELYHDWIRSDSFASNMVHFSLSEILHFFCSACFF